MYWTSQATASKCLYRNHLGEWKEKYFTMTTQLNILSPKPNILGIYKVPHFDRDKVCHMVQTNIGRAALCTRLLSLQGLSRVRCKQPYLGSEGCFHNFNPWSPGCSRKILPLHRHAPSDYHLKKAKQKTHTLHGQEKNKGRRKKEGGRAKNDDHISQTAANITYYMERINVTLCYDHFVLIKKMHQHFMDLMPVAFHL